MTFTLVYVILTTLHHTKNKIAQTVGLLAIGFTVGFNVILGGSVSGASMNPARSFGPALCRDEPGSSSQNSRQAIS
jgi:glycerol uptake facilitator-like aquaporin